VRHERHADHFLRDLGGFVGGFRQFDAAALAATARVDLRLHDHASAELLGGDARFVRGLDDLAARRRHSVAAQDFLRLILVNFIARGVLSQSLVQIGEELTIRPEELVAGGAALARVDGFPIFINSIFPATSHACASPRQRGATRGRARGTDRASADRRLAPCPIAGECGGCDWTALRLDRQLEAKRGFSRSAAPHREDRPGDAAADRHARLAAQLPHSQQTAAGPESGAVGFYAMQSNRVVPLAKECEVVGVETAKTPHRDESGSSTGESSPMSAS